jgi:hypothetical protein
MATDLEFLVHAAWNENRLVQQAQEIHLPDSVQIEQGEVLETTSRMGEVVREPAFRLSEGIHTELGQLDEERHREMPASCAAAPDDNRPSSQSFIAAAIRNSAASAGAYNLSATKVSSGIAIATDLTKGAFSRKSGIGSGGRHHLCKRNADLDLSAEGSATLP